MLREKTKDQIEREEEEYQEYLKREVGVDIRDLVTIEDHSAAVWGPHEEDEVFEAASNTEKRKPNTSKVKEKPETDQEFLMK